MRHLEARAQEQVVRFLRMEYPQALITGGFDTCHLRPQQGMRRKLAGYRPGTPDIIILESRGRWHGLLVEMKAEKGRLSPAQTEFLKAASERGYLTLVAYSTSQAISGIKEYLNSADNIRSRGMYEL